MSPTRYVLGASVLAVVVLVGARSVRTAQVEYDLGTEAADGGQVLAAIGHFRRAARWHVPFARTAGRSIDALEAIARSAEERGDIKTALLAWRSVAGSVASLRFAFSRPFQHRREQALGRANALVVRGGAKAVAAERAPTPPATGTVLLLAGLLLWVLSVIRLGDRGFSRDGSLTDQASRTTVPVVLSFALFVLGMLLV